MRLGILIEHVREHCGVDGSGLHHIFPAHWELSIWYPKQGGWEARTFFWPRLKSLDNTTVKEEW